MHVDGHLDSSLSAGDMQRRFAALSSIVCSQLEGRV